MEILIFLLALILIGTPIIALLAFSGLRRLEASFQNFPPQDAASRLHALEQRLAAVEKALARAGAAASAPPVSTEPQQEPARPPEPLIGPPPLDRPAPFQAPASPTPQFRPREVISTPPTVWAAPPLHVSRPKSASSLDLEMLIAGRWLNRIGIVALITAVSFFLKYAFDNNWIGPSGRVAIGILLGAAMLPWSHWLLARGYQHFSEGIAALGAAVLYLSIWAGWHYYDLFSQNVAFAAMIVVTAVMGAIALGRNSERIALLSLLGGFLTPIMLSTGKDTQVVLFTYLLILGAGLLILAARRDWRSLAPIAFAFSLIYFWGWYESFYNPTKLERTAIFATLLFLLYATVPVIRAVRFSRLAGVDFILILANSFAYLAALYAMLWPQDRWPLTLLTLALSAGHVVAARLIPPPKEGESPVSRFLFAGLALTFATLAIPIRLDGKWITLAFAVEGAILVWTGLRASTPLLRYAGYFLLALAALRLLLFPLPAAQFLFNERFLTYLGLIACFGFVLFAAHKVARAIEGHDAEIIGLGGLAVATNVFALIALSLELWDYFEHNTAPGIDPGLASHLALSVLWTAYATALILVGVKRGSALLRWQALALFGLVVGKVFLYDSSYLDRFYRILSFLILGLVLLVVSFLYQKRASRERAAS
jgi:uncharacterized membrane protein